MPKATSRFPKRIFGSVIELQLSSDIKKVTKPKKHFAYEISVTWTDSTARTVYRSFDDIHEFCTSLLSIDDRTLNIPKLAGRKTFERSTTQNFATKHMSKVRDFIECLLKLPQYIQQGDLFIWFWEPRSEDMIVETPQYGLPPARLLHQAKTVVIDEHEEEQDYICICTALSPFDGKMKPEYTGDKKGLPIKDGDVIYVLGMSDCPTGYWMVRNVFGSEGYVPITNVRVDQDILQRKKLRMSRRLSASQRLNTTKSAVNLAHTRTRKSCSVMDLQRKIPTHLGSTFSPNLERSYRYQEPTHQYNDPTRPYNLRIRRPNYPGHTGSGYNPNRTLWGHEESLTSYNNAIDRRDTDDLIRTLHETSMMIQERMVRSEHTQFKTRELEEILARSPRQSVNFNRSPSKRVRVSGRFKRMSPSPSKYVSPCRRGIGKLRIQSKSPLVAESPSEIMDLNESPSTSGMKRSPALTVSSSKKKKCVDEDEDKENKKADDLPPQKDHDSGVVCSTESKDEEPRRRRSEVARRVSMRLKQVFNSPARTRKTVRRTPRK